MKSHHKHVSHSVTHHAGGGKTVHHSVSETHENHPERGMGHTPPGEAQHAGTGSAAPGAGKITHVQSSDPRLTGLTGV